MMWEKLNAKVFKALKECQVELRVNTTPGIWLGFLLPSAIVISAINHPSESSNVYKLVATLCLGLILTTLVFIVQCLREIDLRKVGGLHCVPGAFTGCIYYAVWEKGFICSFATGFLSGLGYYQLFLFTLRRSRRCFTVGEALFFAQSIILFIYAATATIFRGVVSVPYTNMEIATLTICVGLLNIGFMCMLCYLFPRIRSPITFYVTFGILLTFGIIVPLSIIITKNPLWWMLNLMLKSSTTMKIMFYWTLCSILAVISINQRTANAVKASTIDRKIFHLLAIAVFFPGLLYECTMLYLASGAVFGIFIFLELLRVLKIPPLGDNLHNAFAVFSDEKDTFIALSPMYLFVGIALPLWIHPAPCDIADSCGFYLLPLASGLLTIGVGDSAASLVGSMVGYHRWPGTRKSVEGTLACVISQLLVVFVLLYLELIVRGHLLLLKAMISALVTSLVEARTTQVDNHSLPLIMYIITML